MDPVATYGAQAKREKPLLEMGPLGPWSATVKVVPITGLARGRQFEVLCEWLGPGLEELPKTCVAVQASDCYLVAEPEHARRVALAASGELRLGRVPRLRELAQELA